MTANIIRKRLGLFMMLLVLGVSFATSYAAQAANDKKTKIKQLQFDRRQEQVGIWDCSGVTTAPYGTERPYYGTLKNEWTLDGAWLLVHFEEVQPVTERPMIEDQYWGYNATTNKHIRTVMVNDGSYGVVQSPGWQGDNLVWSGTFTVGDVAYGYGETIQRLAPNRYRWYGSVSQEGLPFINYDLTCIRR
jgi:hypothetical protein